MNKNLIGKFAVVVCLVVWLASSDMVRGHDGCTTIPPPPLIIKREYTGQGGDNKWGNGLNWNPNGVPNGPNALAQFTNFPDGVTVGVDEAILGAGGGLGHGSGGTEGFTSRLSVTDSDATLVSASGLSLTMPTSTQPNNLACDPQVTVRDSLLTVGVPVIASGDMAVLIRRSSGSVEFQQPIQMNNNGLYLLTNENTSGLVKFTQGSAGGTAVRAENTEVAVEGNLTASDAVRVYAGSVTLLGASQLLTPLVDLRQGAGLSLGSSANPLPNLTQRLWMESGTLRRFAAGMATIPNGIHLGLGVSTITAFGLGTEAINFNGGLARPQAGGVMRFNLSNYKVTFTTVQGAAPNSPIYYATFNNDSTFADFDSATGEIGPFTNYMGLGAVGPNDVAGLPGAMSVYNMSADTSAYAVRLGPGPFVTTLNGGGNTLTTNSILVTNTSGAQLNQIDIRPPDGIGDGPNEFITIGAANAQLTMSGVDIRDNTAPTDWTIANARIVVNDPLTKTGVTRLVGSSFVILVAANADLGGTEIQLYDSSQLRVINHTIAHDITVFPNLTGPTIDADGDARLEGDVSINIITRHERPVTFAALSSNDSLTIAGTFRRTGSGNGAAGQGQANVNLGNEFGAGPIITDAMADLTDPGLEIHLIVPRFQHEGRLGETQVHDNVTLSGNGSYASLEFEGEGSTLSPGSSIGTTTVAGDVEFESGGTNNTYAAELTADGQTDRLTVGGTLELLSDSDVLDLSFASGNMLGAASYTLATYAAVEGIFNTVMFAGNPIANPTMPGAFQGTHQLFYGPTALLLTTAVPMLAGDYNGNGTVDAADYVVWRKTLGQMGTGLAADGNNNGEVDDGDYDVWRANFGAMAGSRATAGLPSNAAVPEPASAVLLALGWLALAARRAR